MYVRDRTAQWVIDQQAYTSPNEQDFSVPPQAALTPAQQPPQPPPYKQWNSGTATYLEETPRDPQVALTTRQEHNQLHQQQQQYLIERERQRQRLLREQFPLWTTYMQNTQDVLFGYGNWVDHLLRNPDWQTAFQIYQYLWLRPGDSTRLQSNMSDFLRNHPELPFKRRFQINGEAGPLEFRFTGYESDIDAATG